MILIENAKPVKGQPRYKVKTTGRNNEPLKTSETLNSKQAAWVNILADMGANYQPGIPQEGLYVKDCTVKRPSNTFYTVAQLRKRAGDPPEE